MKARYIRVSSATQTNIRQLQKSHSTEKLFIDVVSGSIEFSKREQGEQLINAIESKEIDYLSVSSIDRLGRNAFDIQSTINWLNLQLVTLKVDNLGLESLVDGKINTTFKMITDVLANVAQMEREALRERQREGIEIAQKAGKYKGRQKGTTLPDEVLLERYKPVVKELELGVNSLIKISKIAEVSLDTVQRVKKAWKTQQETKKDSD